MLKKTFIILYTVLAAISLYIIGAVFNFLSNANTDFTITFWVFDTDNGFLLMSIIVLTFLMGFINIFIFNDDKVESVHKTSSDDLLKPATIEEEINLQIKNKYDDKIIDITNRIFADINSQTKKELKVEKALWSLCSAFELSQGLIYLVEKAGEEKILTLKSTYAFIGSLENINKIEIGYGLNGQVAKSGDFIYLKEVPKGYMKIVSGLGEVSPDFLLIVPVSNKEGHLIGLTELAGLGQLSTEEIKTIIEMSQKIFSTVL